MPHIDPVLQPVDSKKQLMRAVVISEAGFPWKIFWWMEFIFQGIEELNALGPPSQLMSGYPRDLFGSSTCSWLTAEKGFSPLFSESWLFWLWTWAGHWGSQELKSTYRFYPCFALFCVCCPEAPEIYQSSSCVSPHHPFWAFLGLAVLRKGTGSWSTLST